MALWRHCSGDGYLTGRAAVPVDGGAYRQAFRLRRTAACCGIPRDADRPAAADAPRPRSSPTADVPARQSVGGRSDPGGPLSGQARSAAPRPAGGNADDEPCPANRRGALHAGYALATTIVYARPRTSGPSRRSARAAAFAPTLATLEAMKRSGTLALSTPGRLDDGLAGAALRRRADRDLTSVTTFPDTRNAGGIAAASNTRSATQSRSCARDPRAQRASSGGRRRNPKQASCHSARAHARTKEIPWISRACNAGRSSS